MSSFNINGPNNKPMIQESQNMQNNGGGGNLGYFQRGEQEKEFKPQEMVDMFEKEDTFEHENGEIKNENFFEKIISFFKRLFKKLFRAKPKKGMGEEFLTLSKNKK